MEVKQIYELMNTVTNEVLGKTDLVTEDLQGIVQLGTEIFNANAMDKYVKSLVNHIGKMVFVAREYKGGVPSVLMDAWEFGSVLEKVQAELPNATENETWELEDGQSYDPNIFYKPTVTAKFYNDIVTFEVPVSFTDRQVKQSFSNANQLNSFISMIYNAVDKSMTVKIESLVMRTINNFIGETVKDDFGAGEQGNASHIKAVNLLYRYNQIVGAGNEITASECLTDAGFLKYACLIIGLYIKRLPRISSLFNIGGKARFTPKDYLNVILHADFSTASQVYLEADTFHKELVALPRYEEVPYWQSSGTDYEFSSTGKIDIVTSSGTSITVNGVLGVMFDKDALGVNIPDKRVTSNYNGKAEFTNNWFKWDARYFNDTNENFVVFFVADATE